MESLKKNLKWILIALAALVLVFFVGRGTAPTKVETITEVKWKERIVEVERESVKEAETKKEDKDKMYVKIVREKPDGTKETETKVIDKGTIEVGKVKESEKESKIEKETEKTEKIVKVVERSQPDWQISLLGLAHFPGIKEFDSDQFTGTDYEFGLHVQRRIIGDVYVGVYGDSDRNLGLSVGISL